MTTFFNLYHNKILTIFFPTTVSLLKKNLHGCQTVLDLGCGPNSPIQYAGKFTQSVGVETFDDYLKLSKKRHIHTEYLNKKIEDLKFPANSFDAVIAIEVLEHLSKKNALKLINNASRWARKKIIISTPNGFIHQTPLDGNKFQVHLSGWTVDDLSQNGFEVKGLSGLKCLRQEVGNGTMGDDLTASIRFHPKLFWFILATLSQLVTYFFPKLAFELFCVNKKKK